MFRSLARAGQETPGVDGVTGLATNRVFVPPANETYAYDADGNMTEDARFRYYWNGENRMIRAEEKIAPQGRLPYIVTYAYDHMGRNVVKNGSKFIWNDYNIIVEDADSANAIFNTWGLDLDGTMQGAGGVGGLLTVEKGDALYLLAYDANGNATEYLSPDGEVAAHYAYSAFGRQLLAEDDIGFTHRFSTKPYCAKTGLVEFEFRKYLPRDGRWKSRDPLHEDMETEFGSIDVEVGVVEPANQYCGLGNNPVRLVDADGLFAQCVPAAIKLAPAVIELGKIAVAGVAAALATVTATELAKKCPQPKCNPCDPPVGTRMYHFENEHDHHTFTRDIGHTHHFKVLQYPFPNCDCYLKRNSSKATGGYSPAPGEIELRYPTGGGPAL